MLDRIIQNTDVIFTNIYFFQNQIRLERYNI